MNYEQISDEYYNSYKAELRVLEHDSLLISLNKIIKTLFFILAFILTFLITIYIKNNFSSNSSLEIREESSNINQATIELSSKLNMTPEEFSVLVELLKSQISINSDKQNVTYTLSKNI